MVQRRRTQLARMRPLAETIRLLLERRPRLVKQLEVAKFAAADACTKRDELSVKLQCLDEELEEAE
eukprot:7896954-Alexandrium_andersonii.AAC.1